MSEEKLKKQAEICRDMSENLFKEMGQLPPNLVLFKEDAFINVFFDDMDNVEKKYAIAFTAIIAAYYLGDVQAIAFNSEAWALSISEEETPDLWKQFNGDGMKIHSHICDVYGDIASCPYKTEILMTCIDDGKNSYLNRSNILRDGKIVSLEQLDSHLNENKQIDFRDRFNDLLAKANIISTMVNEVGGIIGDLFPGKDNDAVIKQALRYLKKEMDIEFNEDAVITQAKRISKLVGNGKTKVTIH